MHRSLNELIRYVINGLVATAVNYGVLHTCIEVLHLRSAGLANFIGSVFGITSSFLGNRYFVFGGAGEPIGSQALRFLGLYAAIAILNGGVMYIWSDVYGLGYRSGFLLTTVAQFLLSYLGGKQFVFKRRAAAR
ncbi:GtrA family protein [Paraburkholderia sp. JHI869]|uniref:GtrA family protein n=1 Tax=Paraburkholderia sp. JHI869 TaxID=3112959 RepID=UPI00316DA79F